MAHVLQSAAIWRSDLLSFLFLLIVDTKSSQSIELVIY
jgi:hypothetical protein